MCALNAVVLLFIYCYTCCILNTQILTIMHLALDVSDESRGTVVQNADDRLITHILSFGYITHTVWMSVSVLLFVSFIGLLNTWLSTMSNDSKIGKVIYRNSDRLKWILFRFFSLWKHLTENGCIYIWQPSREKGHSSQNFTNSFFSQWFGLSNFFWEGTNIQRYGIMQWIAVSTFVKTFLTKHDLRNKHDTYNSTISIVFYLSYS